MDIRRFPANLNSFYQEFKNVIFQTSALGLTGYAMGRIRRVCRACVHSLLGSTLKHMLFIFCIHLLSEIIMSEM